MELEELKKVLSEIKTRQSYRPMWAPIGPDSVLSNLILEARSQIFQENEKDTLIDGHSFLYTALLGFWSRETEIDDLKQSKDMGDQCLEMIRELLATELDMTHVPPYCYPEAIATVVSKRTKALREEIDDLKGIIALLVASLKEFKEDHDNRHFENACECYKCIESMEFIAKAEVMVKGEKE